MTLVDYSLVPDVAIVDPTLTLTMPPSVTADTGVDALTHALEAGVSIFASPYTDAFCMQAINLIMDALPRACENGDDLEVRTAMSNAATIAGLAFSNAFVGVNHALAHAVGARFGIPHGRANGIFLPHVLRYNASIPSKFMPAPGYSTYVAPDKYAQMGWVLGLGGKGMDERRARFFDRIDELLDAVGMPRSLAEAGVSQEQFDAALPELVKDAFSDPSIRTNPRMPMLEELASLLDGGLRRAPLAMAGAQRMSHADAAWLHMDQPTNLMVITGVLWFDEPPDWEGVRERIRERMVERFPRFRQRVVEGNGPALGAALGGRPELRPRPSPPSGRPARTRRPRRAPGASSPT